MHPRILSNLFLFLALFGALAFRGLAAALPKGAAQQPLTLTLGAPQGQAMRLMPATIRADRKVMPPVRAVPVNLPRGVLL